VPGWPCSTQQGLTRKAAGGAPPAGLSFSFRGLAVCGSLRSRLAEYRFSICESEFQKSSDYAFFGVRLVSFFVKRHSTEPKPHSRISQFHLDLSAPLFVWLESSIGPMSSEHSEFAALLNEVCVEADVQEVGLFGGRPFYPLRCSARAFLAKAFWNLPTNEALLSRLEADGALRRLCGFHTAIPSASTLCRHFEELARQSTLDKTLERVVRQRLESQTVYHLVRDSTSIVGREAPLKKQKEPRAKRRRGRPSKSDPPVVKLPNRIETQLHSDGYLQLIAELPTACDMGTKHCTKGRVMHWCGFKLHIDVTDDGFPVSAITTSASVHDSQAAIPMSRMSSDRCAQVFYELMDKAYDAELVRRALEAQGHVPIIQPKPRAAQLDPAKRERFKARTVVERSFSELKDRLGLRNVRVKGHAKVHTHIMLGVLCLAGSVILRNP